MNIGNIIRWIVAGILLLFSLWAVLGNLWVAFGGLFKRRKRFESFVPLMGGVTGMIGIVLFPVERFRWLWWVPLIVDLGCVPLFATVAIDQIKKAFVAKK